MGNHLQDQLVEFHKAFGHYVGHNGPAVPPDDVVRLRARLIIEEACEALEAMVNCNSVHGETLAQLKQQLKQLCAEAPIKVDLPALADTLGDTDYVVEGTRLAFGINGTPIADAIHAANMAKLGGGKDAHGKSVKPAGWQPPDIAGELKKQGWGSGTAAREPRNLYKVIEQLLDVIPDDQTVLRHRLCVARNSYTFAAPETQTTWWHCASDLLAEFVDPHVQLKEDWALKVVEIWTRGA